MHIVAVYRLNGTAEQLARELAVALGTTPYEARSRVIVPGGGPAVVANFATAASAKDCADRLKTAGFVTLITQPEQLETDQNRQLVRQLQFASDHLQIVTHDGRLSLPYSEVKLLLRGAGIINRVEIETKTEKKFALGRAVASSGLLMRKTVKTVSETINQERQPFCHIYAPGQQPLVLRQAELDYTTLGANRQLSRDANFNWICAELRRCCPDAAWDDRLQTRPGIVQLLGPTLSPECNLDLAITLIAKSCALP